MSNRHRSIPRQPRIESSPTPRGGRDHGRFAWLARRVALLALLWGPDCLALGLGPIRVHSRLGEALRAEVPLTGVTASDGEVEIGLQFPSELQPSGLSSQAIRVRVSETRDSIQLNSTELVTEPLLVLILNASTRSSASVQREYTLILDPPNYGRFQAPSAASGPARAFVPASKSSQASFHRPPVRKAPIRDSLSPLSSTADGSYVVRPGDTLWGLGTALARDLPVAGSQMAVALFQHNPGAFGRGDPDQLLVGSRLSVPSVDEARRQSPREARAMLRGHTPLRPLQSADGVSLAAETTGPQSRPQRHPDNTPPSADPARLGVVLATPPEAPAAAEQGYRLKLSDASVVDDATPARMTDNPRGAVMLDELARIETMIRDREEQTQRLRERLSRLDEQIMALLDLARKQAALALRLDHELRALTARNQGAPSRSSAPHTPPDEASSVDDSGASSDRPSAPPGSG